jgi:enoyl-CoA hydratase
MTETNLLLEQQHGALLTLQLNRPAVHNALNTQLLLSLAQRLRQADADNQIKAVVITGNQKAFAAGADIKEMAPHNAITLHQDPRVTAWSDIGAFSKPMLAAVNGLCLGGGCELAMCADYIIAGDNAKFGQPEIKLGIIPGAGGTQRLVRHVGQARAMQLVLTGDIINASQALRYGLVAQVCDPQQTLKEAQSQAAKIAAYAPLAARTAKDCVRRASDLELSQGLAFERRSYCLISASDDRNEGIQAFLEKREATYTGR